MKKEKKNFAYFTFGNLFNPDNQSLTRTGALGIEKVRNHVFSHVASHYYDKEKVILEYEFITTPLEFCGSNCYVVSVMGDLSKITTHNFTRMVKKFKYVCGYYKNIKNATLVFPYEALRFSDTIQRELSNYEVWYRQGKEGAKVKDWGCLCGNCGTSLECQCK